MFFLCLFLCNYSLINLNKWIQANKTARPTVHKQKLQIRPTDGSRCTYFSMRMCWRRPAAIKNSVQNGSGVLFVSDRLFLGISETADLFPFAAISVVSEGDGPKARKPGTAQDASNLEVDELQWRLTETTPAATLCSPCTRNRGRNLHTSSKNANKNVASREKPPFENEHFNGSAQNLV